VKESYPLVKASTCRL